MAYTRHEVGDISLIQISDNDFAIKQGSNMLFISIDEAREIAAIIDEA